MRTIVVEVLFIRDNLINFACATGRKFPATTCVAHSGRSVHSSQTSFLNWYTVLQRVTIKWYEIDLFFYHLSATLFWSYIFHRYFRGVRFRRPHLSDHTINVADCKSPYRLGYVFDMAPLFVSWLNFWIHDLLHGRPLLLVVVVAALDRTDVYPAAGSLSWYKSLQSIRLVIRQHYQVHVQSWQRIRRRVPGKASIPENKTGNKNNQKGKEKRKRKKRGSNSKRKGEDRPRGRQDGRSEGCVRRGKQRKRIAEKTDSSENK